METHHLPVRCEFPDIAKVAMRLIGTSPALNDAAVPEAGRKRCE
jgi:hypothetical protein